MIRKSILFLGFITSLSQSYARDLTVGLGYIPNIQFAPFYVAETEGFYKTEGLNVQFQHGFTSQLMPLLLSGKIDYLVGDAEDALLARAANQPVKYIFAMYQRVPVAIFSLSQEKIVKPTDLKGKTIGFAGAYGSGYYALLALLKRNKLSQQDVRLQAIGFTQIDAVRSGKVDAASGFLNNEPLVLRQSGITVNVIEASPYYPMVGNGIIATEKTLKEISTARKFLSATQKALSWTIKNPKGAFNASQKYTGELDPSQLEVLEASLPLMKSAFTDKHGLGFNDPNAWARAVNFLKEAGQLKTPLSSTLFFSNSYLTPNIR